ncbi:hypothetical protein Dimus_033866 [Dionaea muscipula]
MVDGREIMVQFAKYGPNAERIYKGRIAEPVPRTRPKSRSPRRRFFSRFGVVKDTFIPRKRNKVARRFGFVRYDCSVAAGVAIQRTNSLWIQDKELKVKRANFERQSRKLVEQRAMVTGPTGQHMKIQGLERTQTQFMKKMGQEFNDRGSYANVVKTGKTSNKDLPSIRINSIGNGWLYRSAVATLSDHRPVEFLIEAYMREATDNPIVRKMGNNKYWGEVIQIEEDTVKAARFDVGKIKIFTNSTLAINHQMHLVVGFKSFVIRVAEEQAVFICNSDFRRQCACHDAEYNEKQHGSSSGDSETTGGATVKRRRKFKITARVGRRDSEVSASDQGVSGLNGVEPILKEHGLRSSGDEPDDTINSGNI